jgi:cytochrome d ubiquinol oxidase subunit I
MFGAAIAATAFVIMGVSSGYLLQGRHPTFARLGLRVSLYASLVALPLQLLSGDLHGLNTAEYQPVKLAAIEGLWNTTKGAPLVVLALPDAVTEQNRFVVEVPHLASLIITHDLNGEIAGLKQVPKDARPNVPLVFYSFRIMVVLGVLMLVVTCTGWVLLRRRCLENNRWFLRIAYCASPSGLLATIAGWCVTETGRQPWVIYGLVKTTDVIDHSYAALAPHFILYVALGYIVLFAGFGYYLVRVFRCGPTGSYGSDSSFLIDGGSVARDKHGARS